MENNDNNNENRLLTFYGDFSLKHWIELLLNKKLKLPEYQRNFVWEPYRVIELYKSLLNGVYVPPVLIAHRTIGEHFGDYILDGQQRLTAILLLYLQVYPDYGNKKDEKVINVLDNEDENFNIDWTITKLLYNDENMKDEEKEICKTIENISKSNIERVSKELVDSKLYLSLKNKKIYNVWYKHNKEIIESLDINSLLIKRRLGYCFIKYEKPNEKNENAGFARIFRSINLNGICLSHQESRRALFWAYETEEYNKFFESQGLENVTVNGDNIDLASLLAYVAEYANGEKNFAVNRRNDESRQAYFNEYIDSVITDEDSKVFGKFSAIVDNKNERMKKVVKYYNDHIKSEVNDKFENIMQLQIYFFGLLYWVIYKNEEIVWNEKINSDIKKYIDDKQKEPKKYNYITEIRERMKQSIKFYK